MDIEQQRKQAQSENTSSAILIQLSANEDWLTRKYVASNPNTPLKVLEKLSQEFLQEIETNPVFDLLILENSDRILAKLILAQKSDTVIFLVALVGKANQTIERSQSLMLPLPR